METLQHPYISTRAYSAPKKSVITKFFVWCRAQEENRIAWLAIILAVHGCAITPLTALFIMASGNNMVLWPFVIGAMTMALVVNLAALPTRITIPIFFFSLLIDLGVIIACITHVINSGMLQ